MSGRSFFLLVFLLVGSLCLFPVTAHPPGNIALSYDSGAGILNVSILHMVDEARDHFIREVTLEMPDNPVQKMEYSSQPDLNEFTYSYPVSIPAGTTLTVTAYCNKFGSLSKSIQGVSSEAGGVPAGSESTAGKTASVPGFIAIGAVLALVCTLVIISVRK